MTSRSLTLLLGGARSGKSRYAESLVHQLPVPWAYIATAQVFDTEMEMRIEAHRARRSQGWITHEEPLELVECINKVPDRVPILVDCLTLWLSNLMLLERDIEREFDLLIECLSAPRGPWFVVSNEVSLGIVPDNALARRFRDAAGLLHQKIAERAGTVFFVVAGQAMRIK